jgi:SAM-dependent methyltransferase
MQASLSHLRQHSSYWHSPAGQSVLAWEQHVLSTFAERVFGFYALSFDLPRLDALHQSTIHHAIHVNVSATLVTGHAAAQFDLHDWPFQNDSLDYIVLPHVLEFSQDPHAVLREAARCLRPGGSMSLTAFNPHSLLGWQAGNAELGQRERWVSRRRLIDWMALLNLHTDHGAFGQWRPMSANAKGFQRWAWMDDAGERWWPHLANVFALRVVKRLSPDLRQMNPKKESLFVLPVRTNAAAAAVAPSASQFSITPSSTQSITPSNFNSASDKTTAQYDRR